MAPHTGWPGISLASLIIGLLSIGPVGIFAQTTDVTCLSNFNWMDNSKGQNPCLVAAYLQGACNGGQFTVDALPNGTHYTGPYADQQNQCQCSSVTYNTISACGLCQGNTIISWSVWDFNCSTVYPGILPLGVPDGTAVPQWAFQDVTQSDLFNATLAQTTGDNPESTATRVQSTGSAGATATGTSASLTPAPSASATSTSTSPGSSSNTGAIAGGVVGGVVGVALIAGIAIFFFMKKRHPRDPLLAQRATDQTSPPTTAYSDGTAFATQMAQPRLYNPSDPTTFPASPPATVSIIPSGNFQNSATNFPATNQSTHSVPPGGYYSGAPEI